ncbi:MAG: pseudouridine synthase [Betaproteobacteria bacterium]
MPKDSVKRRGPFRPKTKPVKRESSRVRDVQQASDLEDAGVQREIASGESHKLQKVMAQLGLGSRRRMEELIAEGGVRVNGEVATIGQRIRTHDVIEVGRKKITFVSDVKIPRVILYHKLEGEIVSHNDPKERATVFEKLPRIRNAKWLSVGRLDFNTGGLLIFTTSGELANRLMHPSFDVEREYSVRIFGDVSDGQMKLLTTGVTLADGNGKFELIESIGGEGRNRWFRVVVKEGRNRFVRRMFESLGLQVSRLMRTRFGRVNLPSQLKRGMHMELPGSEINVLLDWVGLSFGESNENIHSRARRSSRVRRKTESSLA